MEKLNYAKIAKAIELAYGAASEAADAALRRSSSAASDRLLRQASIQLRTTETVEIARVGARFEQGLGPELRQKERRAVASCFGNRPAVRAYDDRAAGEESCSTPAKETRPA